MRYASLRLLSCVLVFLGASVCLMARDFYWENPVPVAETDSRFPSSATNGQISVVLWQEMSGSSRSGSIWLSARVFDGNRWQERRRFAGPFPYSGEIPSIASVSVSAGNRILVSAVTGINTISVFTSDDFGQRFTENRINGETATSIGPRIMTTSTGEYLLFVTRGGEDNFNLSYSRSRDGLSWTPFIPFPPSATLRRAFLPAHAHFAGNEVVVFQAFHEGENRSSFQLFSSSSPDGGVTWSAPRMITSFVESGEREGSLAGTFTNWHNQRARLLRTSTGIALVWERARTTTERYAIYYAQLDNTGRIVNVPERVSSGDGFAYDPDSIVFEDELAIVWFDNRSGVNRVYLATKSGFLWQEADVSRVPRDAVFARLVKAGDDLEVYWQTDQGRNTQRVVRLAPDSTVDSPRIIPVNFRAAGKARLDLLRSDIQLPSDSSGIAGFAWSWSYGEKAEVPARIQNLPTETRLSVSSDRDGSWFLGVRAADYAGNWSEPSYVEYIRDTTPPAPPLLASPILDDRGYLASNTFTLDWKPAEPDDIDGYSWRLDYMAPVSYLSVLASIDPATGQAIPSASRTAATAHPSSFDFLGAAATRFTVQKPTPSVRTRTPSLSFSNYDNGIYALSVSAIDSVGNVGESSVTYIVLNKYIPYTIVNYIDSKADDTGVITLSIVGRGFTEGGSVSAVYLDRDGQAPWDVSLTLESGRYRITNDRLISGITLADIEEGMYRLVLDHPLRGRYMTRPLLSVTSYGTVKFGDYGYQYVPSWTHAEPEPYPFLRPDLLVRSILFFFAVIALLFSVAGISRTAADTIQIRQEVHALLTGDSMPSEKKRRSAALRSKGLGLRFKLAFFTTTLVISVVLIVSIPLGIRFSENQEKVLAQGLESRVNVLLESLASGARAYLPSQNVLELGFLPAQMSALGEAVSATITGNAADGTVTGINYVWATNDPAIAEKIETPSVSPGRTRLSAPENDTIDAMIASLEEQASLSVSELATGITSLTQEGIKLALMTDSASVQRRDEIQTITRQLEEKLNRELAALALSGTGSWPPYEAQSLSRDIMRYVFFRPVLYRRSGDARFVHGTVRVEISTESLLETVRLDQQALVETTVYTALVAVLIGVAGALVLASIIISPVRKLAAHVAMIRDTQDKEELEGRDLTITSRDEIGLLGETINDMTHGLVKAAAASKDLTVGKEVQKMFIPLETDSAGRKLTCGSSSDEHAEFFGYYEGAKGVSGDYFDYIKLDNRHYAIIKCDVAGKGVPAALIMVEVATLFLDYFKDWKYERNGYKLDVVVSRINDLIESRGFKGRFAAFTLLIFDSVSGDAHFCNAGDNLVHIYEASRRKMKTITLPESSAAGVFPTFLVDMKGGFKVSTLNLSSGDVLFLYTDGIEEAKRMFRTKDLSVFACAESGLAQDEVHGSHSVGQDSEELGPERVNGIIEAVFARQPYVLKKWHDHDTEMSYEFDFTSCVPTIEEVTLALVSVEKVFRMYRDPKATEFQRVQVDRKVDLFLNKHFRQYEQYCGKRKDHPDYAEYLYYTHIREDDQYDDLTLLCVKRK